ncbi:MAG: amidohydrolase [Oscillospiraceae bacterium]|nr:amidohydrolase [Oscillospiraceae bacterium]
MADMLETIKRYRIIDSHGHMGPYKLFYVPRQTAASMMRVMDLCGIERVCVSHHASLEVDPIYGNTIVGQAIRESNGRVMGYACINPYHQEKIIPELERCFDKLGFSAIKFHSSLIDSPADTWRYDLVYQFANERRITIMAHNFPDVPVMAKVCEKYPDAFFVQAHYGINWDGINVPSFFELAKQTPNFFIDSAGSTVTNGILEKTVSLIGAGNLLFGTDFSFFDPRPQVGNHVFSKLSEEEKHLVLRENFARLMSFRRS